ncbi:hypothetical protein [Desulfomarina sp.]
MKNTGELWEAIGEINEEELGHVLVRLFTIYEALLARDENSEEALNFFKNLDTALSVTQGCNLNRR